MTNKEKIALVEGLITQRMKGDVLFHQTSVSKHWVIEQIRQRVEGCQLLNAAIVAGTDTTDGLANLQAGAKAIYRSAMRRLSQKYRVESDGWITHRPVEVAQ